MDVTDRKGCEQSDLALGVAPQKNYDIINLYINSSLSGVGSHKRNKLEVIYYDLDLDLGCGSPSPKSLYRPVSPVDWLETAERELYNTGKSSSEGQSPRGSFYRSEVGHFGAIFENLINYTFLLSKS